MKTHKGNKNTSKASANQIQESSTSIALSPPAFGFSNRASNTPIQAKTHNTGCACPSCSPKQLKKDTMQKQGVIQMLTKQERYDNTLEAAGTTRSEWDANYLSSASFLGVNIRNSIHQELANRLTLAETHLQSIISKICSENKHIRLTFLLAKIDKELTIISRFLYWNRLFRILLAVFLPYSKPYSFKTPCAFWPNGCWSSAAIFFNKMVD